MERWAAEEVGGWGAGGEVGRWGRGVIVGNGTGRGTRRKADGTKRVLVFRENTAYSVLLSRFGRGLFVLCLVSSTLWSFSFL